MSTPGSARVCRGVPGRGLARRGKACRNLAGSGFLRALSCFVWSNDRRCLGHIGTYALCFICLRHAWPRSIAISHSLLTNISNVSSLHGAPAARHANMGRKLKRCEGCHRVTAGHGYQAGVTAVTSALHASYRRSQRSNMSACQAARHPIHTREGPPSQTVARRLGWRVLVRTRINSFFFHTPPLHRFTAHPLFTSLGGLTSFTFPEFDLDVCICRGR